MHVLLIVYSLMLCAMAHTSALPEELPTDRGGLLKLRHDLVKTHKDVFHGPSPIELRGRVYALQAELAESASEPQSVQLRAQLDEAQASLKDYNEVTDQLLELDQALGRLGVHPRPVVRPSTKWSASAAAIIRPFQAGSGR